MAIINSFEKDRFVKLLNWISQKFRKLNFNVYLGLSRKRSVNMLISLANRTNVRSDVSGGLFPEDNSSSFIRKIIKYNRLSFSSLILFISKKHPFVLISELFKKTFFKLKMSSVNKKLTRISHYIKKFIFYSFIF